MTDQYLTRDKTLEVTCVGHAAIMMRWGERIIHVDPYGDVADYGQLPDADLILITHHHGDHLDTLAIAEIERPTTQIIGSPTVIRELKRGKALRNGSQTVWNEIPIRAVPATIASRCVRPEFRSISEAKATAICSKSRGFAYTSPAIPS